VLRRFALASLVTNVAIVITGGAVRLTGSGLGCPSWPSCTDSSYVVTRAMGGHGVIEFGNRMLGGVLGLIAIGTLVAAIRQRPRRADLVRLAGLGLAGVLAQGLLGGITVRTGLNPWTVAGHFALSMAVIAVGYELWRRAGRPGTADRTAVPAAVAGLVVVLVGAAALVLALGTIVTGSGPHAGDPQTPRMGFDPRTVAQLHADAGFLLVGLTVATWFALRAVGAPRPAVRAAAALIGIELAQGTIGAVQYALHLPALVVGLHMAGACAVWLGVLALADRVRAPAPDQTRTAPEQTKTAAVPAQHAPLAPATQDVA
jgi:cytochrome c oxidase assembly protein subunit 15